MLVTTFAAIALIGGGFGAYLMTRGAKPPENPQALPSVPPAIDADAKQAAEKAVADKAAAERAAAERAEERRLADAAAAERTRAEKASAEKALAQETARAKAAAARAEKAKAAAEQAEAVRIAQARAAALAAEREAAAKIAAAKPAPTPPPAGDALHSITSSALRIAGMPMRRSRSVKCTSPGVALPPATTGRNLWYAIAEHRGAAGAKARRKRWRPACSQGTRTEHEAGRSLAKGKD